MLKMNYFVALLLIALVSFGGPAFAELEGEYKTPTQGDNQKLLDAGIAHLEEAITAAKAGDGAGAKKHAKASYAQLLEINSEGWAGTLESANSMVRIGGIKVAKPDAADQEKGLKMLETAYARITSLNK